MHGPIPLATNTAIQLSHISHKLNHVNDTGQCASFDNFCIIDKTNKEPDLLIHKSLLILRDHHMLNLQNYSIPLSLF